MEATRDTAGIQKKIRAGKATRKQIMASIRDGQRPWGRKPESKMETQCKIHEYYQDAIEPTSERAKYCAKNCSIACREPVVKTVYIIKKEVHPLKPLSCVYRAYLEDGIPLYIGREKLGELIDYIHEMYPDYILRLEGDIVSQ